MLTTDEVVILAQIAYVAWDAKATVRAVRESCTTQDVRSEGPVRDYVLSALDRAGDQLVAVVAALQALYYAAPPCDLGAADARVHARVETSRELLSHWLPPRAPRTAEEVQP